jgi:hypothetical protein
LKASYLMSSERFTNERFYSIFGSGKLWDSTGRSGGLSMIIMGGFLHGPRETTSFGFMRTW